MIAWFVGATLRRAPRRVALAAVGVAFPVAMMGATLLFVDDASRSMTRVALTPVQMEMKALATTLDVNMGALGRKLERLPGVRHADRFAAADVIVGDATGSARVTARLIAVDPAYLSHHGFARVSSGALRRGVLLNQTLHALPGLLSAQRVTVELPGQGRPVRLSLPVGGVADLRDATSWFEIPTGSVQGDVAMVPRSIVVDYATFERRLLPALRARLGPNTPVLNPDLADLPPVTLESHIAVDHAAYPADPGRAAAWSARLRHRLERQAPPGAVVVADGAFEPLTEASVDAGDARILFLLLGIPGVLVAAALGLAAESALSEAYRREDALLRLRGATDRQLVQLGGTAAVLAGALGIAAGLAVAAGAVAAVTGHTPWRGASTGRIVSSAALAMAAGALATAVRLWVLVRRGREADLVAERRVAQTGWLPGWRRARLDLVALAVGLAILGVNAASGGLKQTPVQGPSIALSFYVLLAPLALWVGASLLAVRGILTLAERRVRPERPRPLASWSGAALRWLGRRPARAAVALVLGSLAVAFATEADTFVATYRSAKRADAHAAFGSDLRLTPVPSDTPPAAPRPGRHLAAVSPIRYVGVRVDTDRKTVMAIDPATYDQATSVAPRIASGGGLAQLIRRPRGVLISKELAKDFDVKPGDPLPVTLFPDDEEKKQNVALHIVGVFRSFPPDVPFSELVMTTSGISPFLLAEPDYYLGRTLAGHSADAVAAELRHGPIGRAYTIGTRADQVRATRRTLTTLNLDGLSRIESIGAALIAAVGVALLGAFVVLERRREFAVLRAVGTERRRLLALPAQEALVAVAGSLAIGIPLGLGLGALSVRVLALFFTLPPPVLAVPVGALLVFVALITGASALALAASLRAVDRIAPAEVLRS